MSWSLWAPVWMAPDGAELEGLVDRFLAEQAVSVVADRALEERRWSTPELLAVEQRLDDCFRMRAGVSRGDNSDEGAESRRCERNVDLQGDLVHADLDTLVVALYVTIDELLGPRTGPGRPPSSATPS
jgi:hypothetical protein